MLKAAFINYCQQLTASAVLSHGLTVYLPLTAGVLQALYVSMTLTVTVTLTLTPVCVCSEVSMDVTVTLTTDRQPTPATAYVVLKRGDEHKYSIVVHRAPTDGVKVIQMIDSSPSNIDQLGYVFTSLTNFTLHIYTHPVSFDKIVKCPCVQRRG
jgi:hypothetical protein